MQVSFPSYLHSNSIIRAIECFSSMLLIFIDYPVQSLLKWIRVVRELRREDKS